MCFSDSKGYFSSFRIGAYYLAAAARSDAHVKDLNECGIDFIIGVNNDKELLDKLHLHGVRAIASGVFSGWFGGNGSNAGTMRTVNPIDSYRLAAERFVDHPALVGIDMGDEPSALDFPYYGEVIDLVSTLINDKLLYLNIYPSYGMLASNSDEQRRAELGTSTYPEYLDSYVKNVRLPYLSFDHYPFSSDKESFFSDLSAAAECAKESGRRLMTVLQVNSKEKERFISIPELRFQAFSALCFGASAITWACYSPGWWFNNVLDKEGNKTEQYDKLKQVNSELHTLCQAKEGFRWQKAVELATEESLTLSESCVVSASRGVLAGVFESPGGEFGILLTSSCVSGGANIVISCHSGTKVACFGIDGVRALTPPRNGDYSLSVSSSEAVFLTFSKDL